MDKYSKNVEIVLSFAEFIPLYEEGKPYICHIQKTKPLVLTKKFIV